MKKILALLAVVLGVVSCQTEPEGLDVNVGGEQEVAICVTIPETETRAGGLNSALGVFDNGILTTDATMRYILQVYYKTTENGQVKYTASKERLVKYSDGKSVTFPVRLVPNRNYQFVVWADVVDGENAGDKHYNTADLANVQLNRTWFAMDETRDAFTATQLVENYNSTSSINIILKRPFAKLRVVTTDMVALNNLGIQPKNATVTYSVDHYNAFNALAGNAIGDSKNRTIKHENFVIASYGENVAAGANMTLFTDYFFAEAGDVVKFELNVFDQNGVSIKKNNFNTDISVQRNYLTTIAGNILTDGNNVTVKVEDVFADNENWPDNNAEQLAYAAMFGGEVTLTDNITLTQPLTIVEGANVVIDLGGKTITTGLKQEGRHHYAIDNYGTLTLKGEGAINARGVENFGTMTINGDITITNVDTNGGSAIWNEGDLVINGGTFTTNAEAGVGSYGTALSTQEGGSAVINGGNFTAYSQLSYAICNYGETVINNATVKGKHGAVAAADDPAYKTTINGGSFELMENPGVSDHCAYYVSEIKGGKFTLGNNTDCGAQVFCASTIAAGYKAVENDGWYYVVANDTELVSSAAEFSNALSAGQNVLLASDVNIAKIDLTTVSNDMVIDGNGNSITTSNFYGVEVTAGKNITLKNTEVVITVDGNYINYSAGFKIANGDYAGNTIKLENCEIRMHNTDWAYAVNMPASVKNLNLVIDKCVLEGAIALQCWGDNNTITVTDSKLICNYTTNAMYTSYCVALQGDGSNNSDNNVLAISNCEFSYSGVDNFNSTIKSVYAHNKTNTNTITVSNCTYVGVTAD